VRTKKTLPRARFFCARKPDSVSAKSRDSHIPRRGVATSLLRLSRVSLGLMSHNMPTKADPSAALHAGKDLAVSPHMSPYELVSTCLCMWRRFRPFALKRLCSHLATYVGRALPATLFDLTLRKKNVSGLSSGQWSPSNPRLSALKYYATKLLTLQAISHVFRKQCWGNNQAAIRLNF